MTDIIALIDEVTTPRCGWCRNPLAEDGPSRDFCGEACQGQWALRCAARDADADDEVLALTAGGLVPSPAEFRPQPPVHVPAIAYDDHRWHTRFRSNLTATFRRLSGVVPPTAVLIGGQRHGQTIGVPDPPRHTLETIEALGPGREPERVSYQLVCHNGVHWCYVNPRPAAPQRTVHVEGHEPLTVDYHHRAFARDTWWVTITGRHRGVLCELPGELLADDRAVSTWFAERSRDPGGIPSWEVTDPTPPAQRPALLPAHRCPHPAGVEFRGTANNCHVIYVDANPDLVLYVRPIHRPECVGVELVDADGRSYIQHVTR